MNIFKTIDLVLCRIEKYIKYQIQMLRHRPKLIWDSIWLRSDEFHQSLDLSAFAYMDMNEYDRQQYIRNLVRRRNAAHEKEKPK
jgi:hypothetical protein